jgi:putative endopeptidase
MPRPQWLSRIGRGTECSSGVKMRFVLPLLVAACGMPPGGMPAPAPAPAAPAPRVRGEPANVVPPDPAPVAAPALDAKPVSNRSLAAVGLDAGVLDRTADPCDDFYQFACGGWIKATEIPADKPLAMRSFVEIADRNLAFEHELLERARLRPDGDPVLKQLGVFYGSCMNEPAIETAGLTALRPLLGSIAKVRDVRSLTAAIAALDVAGIPTLFVLDPVQDAADARRVIAGLDQGGLGLPDRDYYFDGDEQTRNLRAVYHAYIERVFTLLGHDTAKQEASNVIALETEIARVSRDKVARRDARASYNKIDRAGVARLMPRFAWDDYWALVGLKHVKDVTVTSPELLAGLDRLLTTVKPEIWRSYLTFHATSSAAALLTKPLEDALFELTSALTGQPEMSPRWKRCVEHTMTALGDLVGQIFVRERFSAASKAAVEDEIHAIVAAMTANLERLPWMDAATRARAKTKLDAMTYQIGYPRKWKTYSFKLDPRTWTANALAARKAERARELAKIGKPVDRDDWQMTAPQVDAYYDAQLNCMVFPAGILQPPFYSAAASIPVNLGGIGMVAGHELTHGFDDQGSRYDARGNLVNWWEPDTEQQFKQRTQCVIDQYSRYEVSGGIKVNGANTIGENIADIGGVKLAFAAYRELRAGASDTVLADGFTEDQQFFVGFGQAWCAKLRPDFERLLATIDVHSPARWRVNGALSAIPEFGKAFGCRTGSRMMPARQCSVW